ncbi:MAG TPA: hypothetical protein VNA28_07260 [Solirubrobacteraceae bacterium]|nr:hypothetical protein [Solirubrobacteraceae bacterium]
MNDVPQEDPSAITPNPLIERMARATPDGEDIVELRGYVGSSGPGTVRLYETLSMSRYFEIPRAAVVGSAYEGDPVTGRAKLYVRGSTKIVWARSLTASVASRTHPLKGFSPTLRGGWVTGHIECEEHDGEVTCSYVTDLPE